MQNRRNLYFGRNLYLLTLKRRIYEKVMFMFISLLTVLGVCSCNDNEVIEPVVSDSVSDMEVLSRFVDVNEITMNTISMRIRKRGRCLM